MHLDARRVGVVVPAHLKGEGHLVLQYGHDLPIPIPDLQVDDYGVTATLSFARSPHQTVVPWSAVYVVTSDDGRGVLYQEDIPPDVSVVAAHADDADTADGLGAGDARGPGHRQSDHDQGDDSTPLRRTAELAARATPTRALRAVPLGAPLEAAGFEMLADPRVDALPARRRRRPQLRLVK